MNAVLVSFVTIPSPPHSVLALDVLFFQSCISPPSPPQYMLRCYVFEMDITCDVVRIRRVISKPNFGRQGKTLIEAERKLRLRYESKQACLVHSV